MVKPPTEKNPDREFHLSSMKWDTPYASKPSQYGFMEDDDFLRSGPKQIHTLGKVIIAAIIIVILILTYAIILFSIPASILYGSNESAMKIDPSSPVIGAAAQAEEESGSAPLAEMVISDAREEISQGTLQQDSDIPPIIRLIESPLTIEQQALQQGLSP